MRRDLILVSSLLVILLIALAIINMYVKLEDKLLVTETPVKESELVDVNVSLMRFNSYDEIINYINKYLNSLSQLSIPKNVFIPDLGVFTPIVQPTQVPRSTSGESRSRYSRTNIQVEGIDEPDFVKTNGYLIVVYSHNDNRVYIIDTSVDQVVSKISIDRKYVVNGLYLTDKYLVILASALVYRVIFVPEQGFNESGTETIISIYDIRESSNPSIVFNTTVSGFIVNSRLMNNTVYIVTQIPIYKPFVPKFSNTSIPVERIFVITDTPEYYVIVTAIDLNNFNYNILSFIMSSVNWLYMSYSRLYLGSATSLFNDYIRYRDICYELLKILPNETANVIKNYLDSEDMASAMKTLINYFNQLDWSTLVNISESINQYLEKRVFNEKIVFYVFSINNVYVNYTGSFSIDGIVLDQFSMEEYSSKYFVVATTNRLYRFRIYISKAYRYDKPLDTVIEPTRDYYDNVVIYPYITSFDEENNVYVVDIGNLQIIGELRGLAKGERIYSARLIGKILYLVTFRNIDPLFAIDLSNPSDPVVLGYLKIPGFSEYLHPINSDKLLGIGLENNSLKISIFDISNPKNISEVSKLLIPWAYSNILYDYHAFTIDTEYSRIYIQIICFNTVYGRETSGMAVISYENNELKLIKILEHPTAYRSIYVDNKLYTVSYTSIRVYDIDTLDLIKEIELSHGEYVQTITIFPQ